MTSRTALVVECADGDVSDLAKIDAECFAKPVTHKWFSQRLLVTGTASTAYLVKQGKQSVGYVLVEDDRESIEIVRIAVLPEYQRKGYASLLVKRVIVDRPKTLDRVTVLVGDENLPTHLLLKSLGFLAKVAKNNKYLFTWKAME